MAGNHKHDEKDDLIGHLTLGNRLGATYRWGLLLAIAVALCFAAYPIFLERFSSWSPGPLSKSHAMLENNCESCHKNGFAKIDDTSCLSCHTMSNHVQLDESIKPGISQGVIQTGNSVTGEKRCSSCHIEHHGLHAFMPTESKLCTDCHGNISKTLPSSTLQAITSLSEHPQFKVVLDGKRVSLDDSSLLKDPSTLKMNHAVHLKQNLNSPDGPVTLNCSSCHMADEKGATMKSVTFEKNCRSCHPLSFDDRLPQSKIPHGDTEAVLQFLLGEYSKLYSSGQLPSPRQPLPGAEKVKPVPLPANNATIVEEARVAERLLFTKTSCQLCHQVTEKSADDKNGGLFTVAPVKQPSTWFTHAKFSHGAHQIVSCEDCHAARTSKETGDVLLPKVETCRQCHVQAGEKGLLPTDCSTCHVFHKSQALSLEQSKTLTDFLHGLR